MPVVVSVLFFLVFHVLSITGEKLSEESVVYPAFGMWLASLVLLPIGIFLTYKATTDSTVFDFTTYFNFFKKLIPNKDKSDEAASTLS
jgi:lipopolysaccharide export system permease protein